MHKKAALWFGVVLLVVGVLGFIPALAPKNDDGMPLLIGLFMVGALHNVIHLVTGAASLISSSSDMWAKRFFQVFGVVYALVAIIGFIQGNTVLGIIDVNLADNLLHTAIALFSLWLGFGVRSGASAPAAPAV